MREQESRVMGKIIVVNGQAECTLMKTSLGFLVVGALFLTGLSSASGVPNRSSDRTSLYSGARMPLRRGYSVDLGPKSIVDFRSCDAPDPFGCCKSPWRTAQRRLSPEELKTLAHLALESKLFSGPSNGGHIDLNFRWLEVRSRNEIAMLMVTLNDSFLEPSPRRMLLERLHRLQTEMMAVSAPTSK
jgi:hypothetical protein